MIFWKSLNLTKKSCFKNEKQFFAKTNNHQILDFSMANNFLHWMNFEKIKKLKNFKNFFEKVFPLHTSPFHYARMFDKGDWFVWHDQLCHTLKRNEMGRCGGGQQQLTIFMIESKSAEVYISRRHGIYKMSISNYRKRPHMKIDLEYENIDWWCNLWPQPLL